MKFKFLFLMLIVAIFANQVFADTYVRGYTRSDGTYVNGYYRSSPNYTRLDNYSTKGNYNPYTGKAGTVNPYNQYGSAYNNSFQRSVNSRGFGYQY